MSIRNLRLDLSALKQGLQIGFEFGIHSLGELAVVAEIVEHSVYERDSLTSTPSGLTFALRNPPLRLGAFSKVRLFLDGVPADPDSCRIQGPAERSPRRFSTVSVENPVILPLGGRVRFWVNVEAEHPKPSRRVRLEFTSVAIPPLVWLEVTDTVHRPEERT